MFRKKPFWLQDANREMEAAGVGEQATISNDVTEDEIQTSFYRSTFEPEDHQFALKRSKNLHEVARNRELKMRDRAFIEEARVPPFTMDSDLFERHGIETERWQDGSGYAFKMVLQEMRGEKNKPQARTSSPLANTKGTVSGSSPSKYSVQDQQEMAQKFERIYKAIKEDRRKEQERIERRSKELLYAFNMDVAEENFTKEQYRHPVLDISPSPNSRHIGSKTEFKHKGHHKSKKLRNNFLINNFFAVDS